MRALSNVFERTLPSSVSIIAVGTTRASTGTGILVTSDGYVLTCAHLVNRATSKTPVKVGTWDRKERQATVVNVDDSLDLAVLRIDGTGFRPVHL
ncbi:MAG: serine protease, partial [Terracidiphilus sp.]